ncbi:DUF1465 family protein [Sphingomonas sp.]|uniref:DUF1465 family protein n=1 Tax=Sphingomonas sp. TaxID=28214 RepID=UPI0031D5DC63
MLCATFDSPFQSKLIDGLYAEAMVLAETARDYFDGIGREEREQLDPVSRVAFSCESLKVTTRLMHVIAWVMTQRAVEAGEMDWSDARDPMRRLGCSPDSDPAMVAALPDRAQFLAQASLDLHRRVERLDQISDAGRLSASPVQMLQARLGSAF